MLRIGQGYDIHRLEVGRRLRIGGVEIPYEKGLAGHSDADILIHAIIDALVGALAFGDIGKLFPNTDDKYKNIDSRKLLKHVVDIVLDSGYKINNIDATIIIENPKLRNYIDQMRQNLSVDLQIELDQINIKAKTNEAQDSIGAGLAASAYASVILIR
jgi:2-C-methyl-D-erythritol 2,4-cyclodiphosphate synthase